jgi:DNA repair protein RadA/Sms
MARARAIYRCSGCGASTPKWAGRCATCEEWNSLVEELELPSRAGAADAIAAAPAQRIADVAEGAAAPRPTGVPELDRVLGGGLVDGSVTLVGGEPGIGKSTLLLQLLAARGGRCLYVSAEESAQQVAMRAARLGAAGDDLWIVAETVLPHLLDRIAEIDPQVIVVDSIQSIADPELASAPGSVGQVRECAHRLAQVAKQRSAAVVLVGHVTKEGTLAGPRVLEHLVDTVLSFEGDRHHALRMLRAVKHRFGPTQELGLFEMTEAGLVAVDDPSSLFLSERRRWTAGSAVTATIEGHRPLLVEVQSLVVSTPLPQPRRSAQGFDQGRLALLLAVIERRCGLACSSSDVYVSALGGVRLAEPGADLAVCLAIGSARLDRPIEPGVIAVGEVGLSGDLRQVSQTPRRLAEAARLGFTRAIVPPGAPSDVPGLQVVHAGTLIEAMLTAGLSGPPRGVTT